MVGFLTIAKISFHTVSPPPGIHFMQYHINFPVMTEVFVGFAFSIVRTCLQRGATICIKQGSNSEQT
jgi:hypothetical protein